MPDILRNAEAVWNGDLKGGNGTFGVQSGAFQGVPYTFATRFESAPGTNPEELLAAAYAACYSMALSATLGKEGYKPLQIATKATCSLSPLQPAGFKISKMKIETKGKVEGIDAAKFVEIAQGLACPVSNLLKPGLDSVEVEARLL